MDTIEDPQNKHTSADQLLADYPLENCLGAMFFHKASYILANLAFLRQKNSTKKVKETKALANRKEKRNAFFQSEKSWTQ